MYLFYLTWDFLGILLNMSSVRHTEVPSEIFIFFSYAIPPELPSMFLSNKLHRIHSDISTRNPSKVIQRFLILLSISSGLLLWYLFLMHFLPCVYFFLAFLIFGRCNFIFYSIICIFYSIICHRSKTITNNFIKKAKHFSWTITIRRHPTTSISKSGN